MGISVGAALKKIAVALVSDKKTLKNIAMAALVIIVALLMPMAAIIAVFSGTLELDVAALQEQIAENMSDSDRQMLQQVEDNMNAIQTALREADMASRVKEAQVLYILALYDHSSQLGFVSRLVSCFQPEQTDDQLIAAVNSTFGTNIVTEDFVTLIRVFIPIGAVCQTQGREQVSARGFADAVQGFHMVKIRAVRCGLRELNNIRNPEVSKFHIFQGVAVEGVIYGLIVDTGADIGAVPDTVLLGVGQVYLVDGQGAFGGGIDGGVLRLGGRCANGEAQEQREGEQ